VTQDPTPAARITCHSEQDTGYVGAIIGRNCQGGEVILLDGPMGAGKTCMAAAVARGMQIDQLVISPTYTILRSYQSDVTGLTLHHLDLYRLGASDELDLIGWTECLDDLSVILVEWPERCPDSFHPYSLLVRFEDTDEDTRVLSFYPGETFSERFEGLIKGLQGTCG
jgi:tRNA threonylcarbamoyladenosine biosynthesis protein TsaE